MERAKKVEDPRHVSVTIEGWVHDVLVEKAKRDCRNLRDYVRRLLKKHAEEERDERPKI